MNKYSHFKINAHGCINSPADRTVMSHMCGNDMRSWVLWELPDSSFRNNQQPHRETKTLNKKKKKPYTCKKKANDKVIANKQPNVGKRVDSKRAELSKLPKHAKCVLHFSSNNHCNNI